MRVSTWQVIIIIMFLLQEQAYGSEDDDDSEENNNNPYCNPCGYRMRVDCEDCEVSIPTQGTFTCGIIETRSREGYVEAQYCRTLQAFTRPRCDCVSRDMPLASEEGHDAEDASESLDGNQEAGASHDGDESDNDGDMEAESDNDGDMEASNSLDGDGGDIDDETETAEEQEGPCFGTFRFRPGCSRRGLRGVAHHEE